MHCANHSSYLQVINFQFQIGHVYFSHVFFLKHVVIEIVYPLQKVDSKISQMVILPTSKSAHILETSG